VYFEACKGSPKSRVAAFGAKILVFISLAAFASFPSDFKETPQYKSSLNGVINMNKSVCEPFEFTSGTGG
jgi:hypothetical protein